MTEVTYNRQLLNDASSLEMKALSPASGSAGWSCPSNIALIKYWGKRPVQIPMNPSLSMTLDEARTFTRIDYTFDPAQTDPAFSFSFEGSRAPAFAQRIEGYLKFITPYLPMLAHTSLQIESRNTFPHSSGIASSASAMGALALCLLEMEQTISGTSHPEAFMRKASFLARLGSGSAGRSLFPQFSLWGKSAGWTGSSDEFAISYAGYHPTFRDLRDTILIVEAGAKKVSSSAGHGLMEKNPYAPVRFTQARENLAAIRNALESGDWQLFLEIMEMEALALHAMMLTGKPGYLLMQPGTLSIIQKIREFRKDTGKRLGFTLDAGANVHLIFSGDDSDQVHDFISSELLPHCENGRAINDRMGDGPQRF
jgi:diphosphomevalonate decarboxylase